MLVTVAIVTLALVLAGAAGAIVVLALKLVKSKDETLLIAKAARDQERVSDELRMQRDEWKIKHDLVNQQLSIARVRLMTSEVQRNQSYRDATNAIVEKVRTSNAKDAAGVLNDLLSMSLGPMPKADPAGTDNGNR